MTDVQEEPAVPPMDPKGDPRAGYFIAGGLLIFLGWGMAVLVNLLAHRMAPARGLVVGWMRIFPTLGPYAWGALGLGVAAGALGVALVWLGTQTPKGPWVLPGVPYTEP
ncbi:MAG: hypothetical protein ACYCPN_02050 [Thermoplasmata archaeon]